MIRYIKHKEIDKKRWDEIVDKAPNGRVYAYSWYLDAMVSDQWDALIWGDYEYIMPLPWKVRYGIPYLMTPYFIQQLGIYSQKDTTPKVFTNFIHAIPFKFRYINLNINSPESISETKAAFKQKRRTNFTLDINCDYDTIALGYSRNIKRILKTECDCRLIESNNLEGIIRNFQQEVVKKTSNIPDVAFSRLLQAALAAQSHKQLLPVELLDSGGKMIASFVFFLSHGRIYYIAGTQTPEGKALNATYRLIDELFKKYNRTHKIFDFEGSDIPGVAEFFKKWGSVPEYYTNIECFKFPTYSMLRSST